jgi:hypothetical protein
MSISIRKEIEQIKVLKVFKVQMKVVWSIPYVYDAIITYNDASTSLSLRKVSRNMYTFFPWPLFSVIAYNQWTFSLNFDEVMSDKQRIMLEHVQDDANRFILKRRKENDSVCIYCCNLWEWQWGPGDNIDKWFDERDYKNSVRKYDVLVNEACYFARYDKKCTFVGNYETCQGEASMFIYDGNGLVMWNTHVDCFSFPRTVSLRTLDEYTDRFNKIEGALDWVLCDFRCITPSRITYLSSINDRIIYFTYNSLKICFIVGDLDEHDLMNHLRQDVVYGRLIFIYNGCYSFENFPLGYRDNILYIGQNVWEQENVYELKRLEAEYRLLIDHQ